MKNIARRKKLNKAYNIKRNNLSKMTRIRDGYFESRDAGLAFATVTAKNAQQFINHMHNKTT